MEKKTPKTPVYEWELVSCWWTFAIWILCTIYNLLKNRIVPPLPFSSVQFSYSVVSNSMRAWGLVVKVIFGFLLGKKENQKWSVQPAKIQGKYVKKETSPLLRNLMPSFIRHGPTIPRWTGICLPDSSENAFSASGDGIVSRNHGFLRTPI